MRFELIHKITKITLLVLFVLLLVFLSWQKSARSAVYMDNFSDQGKFIFGLYPAGRIVQLVETQRVIGEPVYIDVYAPLEFKKAKVNLRYLNNTGLEIKFGLKLNVNDWSFYMIKMNALPNKFIEQAFEFDLTQAERIKNKIRFIIAAPGIKNANGDLLIDNVGIQMYPVL